MPLPFSLHRAHRGHVPDDALGQEEAAAGRQHAERDAARLRCPHHRGDVRDGQGGQRGHGPPRRRPGVDLLFAKNSIGAVLTDDEYNRIVHGIEHDLKSDADIVPDDASSLTETDESADAAAAASDDKSVDLGKKDATEDKADEADEAAEAKADEEPKKTDGDTDAK